MGNKGTKSQISRSSSAGSVCTQNKDDSAVYNTKYNFLNRKSSCSSKICVGTNEKRFPSRSLHSGLKHMVIKHCRRIVALMQRGNKVDYRTFAPYHPFKSQAKFLWIVRWKRSSLITNYDSSKTLWPVTRLEAEFLPEFPSSAGLNLRNCQFVEEIGRGAFGEVVKVRRGDGREYAVKILSKSKIIRENCVRQVKQEVQIQRVCGHHPFIVNCPYHWQSRTRLFIVSDFVEGGELYNLLKKYAVLPIALVQLYVAQLAHVTDFLHNAGIIYRDLKPENILLDKFGNIQLIDFGLAKWLSRPNTTKTVCGSLKYMAPEILGFESYGHAVDWWSLGIIACLMLTGKFPILEITENRKKFISIPEEPKLDASCMDLLNRLLEIDPVKRLRSLRSLKNIAFYKNYDFSSIIEKKINPNDLLRFYFPNGAPSPTIQEWTTQDQDQELIEF